MTIDDFPRYHYQGTVVRVIDGDTVEIAVDCGFRITHTLQLRLAGINAPELRGEDRPDGLTAVSALSELVRGQTVRVRTHKDGRSFSRYVGDLFVERDGALVDVADVMVNGGYAVRVAP